MHSRGKRERLRRNNNKWTRSVENSQREFLGGGLVVYNCIAFFGGVLRDLDHGIEPGA